MIQNIIKEHGNTFVKFCIIGGLSTIINYSLFYLLYSLQFNYLPSSSAGYIAGTFFGFFLNKKYTFESKKTPYKPEILKYFIIYAISLFLGLLLLRFLVGLGLAVTFANLLIIGFTTITNYIGIRYIVFAKSTVVRKVDYIIFRYKYLLTYIFIGLSSLVVEILAIYVLQRTGAPITQGIYFLSFLLGMVLSFVLNTKINFRVSKNQKIKVFYIFALISTFSYALNLLLLQIIYQFNIAIGDYASIRLISAGCIFLISYSLHRKITFKDTKEVGIAIYLKDEEDINGIYDKVKFFPDWIHVDIVDKTIRSDAAEVNYEKGLEIKKQWPKTMVMTHIMSKRPSSHIQEIKEFSEYIIVHLDIDEKVREVIAIIKKTGRSAGICIDSNFDIGKIPGDILRGIDMLQILGIDNPGESGQEMNNQAVVQLGKINILKKQKKYNFKICFDGGIKFANIDKIDAKYIVSGSTVLSSKNPKHSIFTLKSGARYYDKNKDTKEYIKNKIYKTLENIPFVASGTLVGSFVDKKSLEGMSDIDTIVIVDKLSKNNYDKIIKQFEKIGEDVCKKFGYKYIINPTFGPLKFNDKDTVVFHLMIYDKSGHKDHCIKSPFTCLEWERSENFVKSKMSEIWAVNKLQPNYFFNSRRSISDYMQDLNKSSISYREYIFKNNEVIEEKKYKRMSNRDKFEFSYHIMKFCMLNFLKLYHHNNKIFSNEELVNKYFSIFPKNKAKSKKLFYMLQECKSSLIFRNWEVEDNLLLELFLKDFEEQFEELFKRNSSKIYFMRHQKTKLNKNGLFLGQKLNPEIVSTSAKKILEIEERLGPISFDIISSTMKRAQQTAKLFKGKVSMDTLISEINYGLAEGKDLDFLKENYKEITSQWDNDLDPRFPEGENMRDVLFRVRRFLRKLKDNKNNSSKIIVTHNVFLRCLVGEIFKIPIEKWFRLNIDYLDPMEVIRTGANHFYINLTPRQLESIFKEL